MTRNLLLGVILLPIFYFGMQIALAPAFPGYSVLRDATSILGSDKSPVAFWFNLLAILGGVLGIVGALGAYRAFRADGGVMRALILPLLIAITAGGSIWAGIFPLPHPLHAANPAMAAMLALPVATLAYSWWAAPLRPLRSFLLLNFLAFLIMIPITAGLLPIDRGAVGGLLQRLLALTIFVPIGVIGWQLRRYLRT